MNNQRAQEEAPLSCMPFTLQSNLMPSKCLSVRTSGTACRLWDQGQKNDFVQEWLYDGKRIRSAKDPSKCIQLQSGNGKNGDVCRLANVQQGDHPDQEWTIDDNLIKSVKFPHKCIHLEGLGSTRNNGTICHLWDVMKSPFRAQEWKLVPSTSSYSQSCSCIESTLYRQAQEEWNISRRRNVNRLTSLFQYPFAQDLTDKVSSKLFWAVQRGSYEEVSRYLEAGVNPNAVNNAGETLLHLAVKADKSEIVDLLLHTPRINISEIDKANRTPLILAMKLKRRRIVSQIHTFESRSMATYFLPSSAFSFDRENTLGFGAYGYVVKGTVNNQMAAIKIPHSNTKSNLVHEISTMTKFSSPYIVNVVAACRDENCPLLALEFMDCGDLRTHMKAEREGKQTKMNVTPLEVAWVVANAIADLHHNSLLHRDIKSANVLLSTKNYIKLGDFGTSREIVLETMSFVGTPYWIAPEVLKGDRYSYAADIYSFGVLLTELDTKNTPYAHSKLSPLTIIERVKDGSLRPALSNTCATWLKDLAEKCLSFKADCRPSAHDIVDYLERYLNKSN